MTLPSRPPEVPPELTAPVVPSPLRRQLHDGAQDRALVARVIEGDAMALEELYGRYGRPCYALARRILTDSSFAEDVVQEVFLALWRDADKFDPTRGAFASWLLSMTHHKAVDRVRREETLRKRRTTVDALEATPSDLPGVDEQVWSGVRGARVREALATLPPAQRQALELAYFGGHTQREIAGLTDTPLGTVKTRMLSGMRKMRDSLETITDAAVSRESGNGLSTAGPHLPRTTS